MFKAGQDFWNINNFETLNLVLGTTKAKVKLLFKLCYFIPKNINTPKDMCIIDIRYAYETRLFLNIGRDWFVYKTLYVKILLENFN